MHKLSYRMAARLLVSLLAALCWTATRAEAQPRPVMNAAETRLALRKLNVLASVLYVGAHPDDENTAMLAYLSQGRAARAAYLSMTRGDGGQNLIGSEQGELLGLLRTQELLAARRIDGAEQFFTRALDFGFSKTPEETLRIWGREQVLADVVWVIRRFRPDVIVTRFPTTGAGGHGHHTASAILAEEAFRAAADSSRFPEQLPFVQTWQARRLVWNFFGRPPEGSGNNQSQPKLIGLDLGAYNPLLGKSYTEIAAQSRSMHKSQGFGSAERRGTAMNYLQHLAGGAPVTDIFDGIDTSWRRLAGGERLATLLAAAERSFKPEAPHESLPALLDAYAELGGLQLKDPLVEVKREELSEVIRSCAGLWMEAVASDFHTTPGAQLRTSVMLVNRSGYPLRLEKIELPHGAPAKVLAAELRNNQPVQTEVVIPIPLDAAFSQPYWLRAPAGRGTYALVKQALAGLPENPPALDVRLTLGAGEGHRLSFALPILFRWTDRVRGEQYRPVEIVPRVAVNFEEKTYVFPDAKPKSIRLLVKSNAEGSFEGTLRLRLPAGWSAVPDALPVRFRNRSEELSASFTVKPPAQGAQAAPALLAAELAGGAGAGRELAHGISTIAHEHIPVQTLLPPAEARLVRLELARRGTRVGYVMGSGDEIPQALRQVGYEVALLGDEDLEQRDLHSFDAIILGVRAYNTRPRLAQQSARLLAYVREGGTLITQYNTDDARLADAAPYPFKLSRARVTVEEAPVKFLLPEHPLVQRPNRITPADFEHWIQERGLYFPSEWDERYQTPFGVSDPGEKESRGSTLVARYGRGTYIYTSLSWFRQLPAGVPGAYRLFVNLISAGK